MLFGALTQSLTAFFVKHVYVAGIHSNTQYLARLDPVRAVEANGLEMPVGAGKVEKTTDHEIRVGMRGFEVKTVLLTFGETPDS